MACKAYRDRIRAERGKGWISVDSDHSIAWLPALCFAAVTTTVVTFWLCDILARSFLVYNYASCA